MPDETKDAVAPERTRMIADLWSRSIDAQLELARIAARSRQIGIALIGVALLIAAVMVSSGARTIVAIGSTEVIVHASALVLGAAALIVVLLRVFDLGAQERMQRGAASVSEALEELEPGILKGMSKKMAFVAEEQARRSAWHAAFVPGVAALLVVLATNVLEARRTPLAPALAEEELPVTAETELVNAAPVAPAVAPVTAPPVTAPAIAPVVMRAEVTGTKPVGKKGAAKPVEGKAAAPGAVAPATTTTTAAAPATTAAAPAEPPKAEPPKAEPPPAKAEEPKPTEPAAPPPAP